MTDRLPFKRAQAATSLFATTCLAFGCLASSPSVAAPQSAFTRVERAAASGERFQSDGAAALEITFADGGSVTLAPGSEVVIDAFRFDSATGSGELGLTLTHGAIRVMGGLLNQRQPIAIRSGSVGMTLTNGGAFISRSADTVRAALLVGGTLEVNAAGRSKTLTRPGFETVSAGDAAPTDPVRQRQGQAFVDAAEINPGLRGAGKGGRGAEDGGAEERAVKVVLDDENAKRSQAGLALASNYMVVLPDGAITTTLSPTKGPLASFGLSSLSDSAIDVVLSQEFSDPARFIEADPLGVYPVSSNRQVGLTANRVLQAGEYQYDLEIKNPGLIVTPLPDNLTLLSDIFGSSSIEYAISTTLFGTTGFHRDTVFALTNTQNAAVQVGSSSDNTRNLLSYAIAFPYEFVFSRSNIVQISELTRPISLSISNLTPSARPMPADQTDPIFLGVRALSSGFLPVDNWIDNDPNHNFDLNGNSALGLLADPRGSNSAIDNFVMIEAEDRIGNISIFAAGDVSSSRENQNASIDAYILSRGLNPADFIGDGSLPSIGTERNFKSFIPSTKNPPESSNGLASTPLLVYNHREISKPSALYHADLAVEGEESTISTTLGSIRYDAGGLDDGRALVTVNGTTIGSNTTPGSGSTLFTSPLIASAVGGGGNWGGFGLRPGYATYFVLENVSNDAVLWTFPETAEGQAAQAVLQGQSLADLSIGDILARSNPDVVDDRNLTPLNAEQNAAVAQLAGLTVEQMQVLRGELPLPLSLQGLTDDEIEVLATGGLIEPLGQTGSNYGYLRLASGVQSEAVTGVAAADREAAAGTYAGFVAGLHQVSRGYADGLYQGTLALGLDADTSLVGAAISYVRPVASSNTGHSTSTQYEAAGTIALGAVAAEGGESAYIRPGYYGASVTSTGSANAALIAGEGVKQGLGAEAAGKIGTYQHVQWGFFFGDLLPQAGQRTHTALSSWVAGRRADVNERIQGTASYAGHAIGTVIRQADVASVYTAVGTFEQCWNLDARVGSMAMEFDGNSYRGADLAPAAGRPGIAYKGYLTNTSGPVLQAKVEGELVDVGRVGSAMQPQGTIGTFTIRGFDASYQAGGTFAGDIKR